MPVILCYVPFPSGVSPKGLISICVASTFRNRSYSFLICWAAWRVLQWTWLHYQEQPKLTCAKASSWSVCFPLHYKNIFLIKKALISAKIIEFTARMIYSWQYFPFWSIQKSGLRENEAMFATLMILYTI